MSRQDGRSCNFMGKYLPRLRQVTRTATPQFAKSPKPAVKDESVRSRVNQGILKGMESSSSNSNTTSSSNSSRLPLSEVVSECVKRWFKDTLKEAKAGDINMQVLVGQMYYSGYGVPRDAQKGRVWMTRASRIRSSVWKVSDKRPGYNASDSDSDEIKGES